MKITLKMPATNSRVSVKDMTRYFSRSNIRSVFFAGSMMMLVLMLGSSYKAIASQSHPNLVRGNADEKIVEKQVWDKINLFNGNLGLNIPLGIDYPLSENFGYQLSLNYNSNVWDLTQSSPNVSTASPVRHSNAGFGWDLSLGRLVAPTSPGNPLGTWIYISPEGAVHSFYQSLHFDVDDYASNVYYTRDATYYRLTQTSPASCLLENPNGIVSTFQLINSEWRLVRMADRFTNYLSISYSTPNTWLLTDNHGRTHTIYFKSDPSGLYPAIVDRIVLAAFGNTSATYTFSYTTSSIYRPGIDNDPATATTVMVPLLRSVSMPDGSQYSLNYHGAELSADWSGRIATMELPTRGSIEWTYQPYLFTVSGCLSSLSPIYRASVGVATRKLVDGGTVTGTWTYSPVVRTESDSKKCEQSGEMTNIVTTPLGDKTVYYFSVNTQSTGSGFNRSDYALPFTKSEADSTGSRYLSRQYYDCDETGNNCRLLRSFYVRYEQDSATNPAFSDVADVNRREVSQRVVYHDDVENSVARFADIDRSGFDGLGNFRQHVTNGNFGSGDVRQTLINYDATPGTYPSAAYMLPTGSWILNTYSQYKVVEGQSSQVIDYCYDRVTGFLKRRRQWKSSVTGGSAGANDVVTVFTPDTEGQVSKQQYYGGDIQAIGTGNLCSLSLPAAQYEIRHTYQYGMLSTSQFVTETGNSISSKQVDRENDKNTGLVKTSRDGAGVFTQFEYDILGRLKWTKPQQGAWSENRYLTAMTSGSAKMLKYKYPNGAVTGPLTYNAEVYDAFGRLLWEQTWMPDGTFPARYKSYNALGHMTGDTAFTNSTPNWIQYLNYDPFGRVQIIRPATGAQHDINLVYSGVRTIKRTGQTGTWYNAATGVISEQPRSTTSVYDRQSRLWKEIVNSQNPHAIPDNVVVSLYDVAGELIQKTHENTLIGKRRDYDGRGFLFMVSDGEGNNSFYQNFDALGNARKQRPNDADLNYEFDRAGRLISVRETNAPAKLWKEYVYADDNGVNDWRAGKLWKTKRYNYFPNTPTATISETYAYSGKAGQVSQYEIEWNDGTRPSEKFVQGYVYDDLGNMKEILYPQEVTTANTNLGRTRRIVNTFSQNYLIGIAGISNSQNENWATAINYHSNGLVSRVAHSNGVTENITNDPNGYARPAFVSTTGVKQLYEQADQNYYSGSFQYDGMGHLVRVGNEYFLPQEGYQPPTPVDYTPVNLCLEGEGIDPFGLPYVSVTDSSCSPLVFSFYTVDDIEVKIEDRRDNTNTWTFYDPLGRTLTKYSRSNTNSNWIVTQDYIYRGGILLAVDERLPSAPHIRIFHYSPGYGGTGIITDRAGAKIQP
jgi:hypothetical protein